MSVPAVRAAPVLAPGTRPVPGYEVLAHLARTGWLDVYDVWSQERDCRCVVKAVRPDRREQEQLGERLLREGRWLGAFTHPHLVRAYETFESPVPLVVLETLTGETLSHLIHRLRRGRPPPTWRCSGCSCVPRSTTSTVRVCCTWTSSRRTWWWTAVTPRCWT
ncbi:hypothetical protein [Streptomyces cathayae]|uniref:Protein kinase domain-containing protein n=1 Tax=Streptomyces cathayae TaxID=3031124 RepID=A0ABY8KC74_9ACTN|nr:hypothetical protein [Streptomyces sp. HUAS 5]WGD45258.1 hypothetical protein PYS65_34785 [Streptomyces sp. HUAS 5]